MDNHDQVAELRALRVEHGYYLAAGRTERAEQVARAITGVVAALADRVEQLDRQAEVALATGADVAAAEATVQARVLQAALDEDQAHTSPESATSGDEVDDGDEDQAQPPAARTAQETAPTETATTRRGGRGRKTDGEG